LSVWLSNWIKIALLATNVADTAGDDDDADVGVARDAVSERGDDGSVALVDLHR